MTTAEEFPHPAACPAPCCWSYPVALPYSPTPNKWRMEVLTRDATGTAYTYYRYSEGEQPLVSDFEGKPIILGSDQLVLGYEK